MFQCPIDVFPFGKPAHQPIRIASEAQQTRRTDNSALDSPEENPIVHEKVLSEFERLVALRGIAFPACFGFCFRDGQVSNNYQELIVTGWAGIARPESGIWVQKAARGASGRT